MRPARQVDYRSLRPLSAFHTIYGPEMTRLALTVDPNNEQHVKSAIRMHIVPHVAALEKRIPGVTEEIKEALRYYLTTGRFPIEALYEAGEPAFELPDNPLDYYRWAWEVCFPGEEYRLASLDGYEEAYAGPP
jgi:hypothetical protein